MKTEKTIDKAMARSRTKGGAAVTAAVLYTFMTAANGYLCINNGSFGNMITTVVACVMCVNTLCLWLTVICPNTFGLAVTRFFQIIELVASAALFIGSAVLTVFHFTGTEVNLPDIIADLAFEEITGICAMSLLSVLMRCAVLKFISVEARSYKGKTVKRYGGTLKAMSVLAMFISLGYIPAMIFRCDLFASLGIEESSFAWFKGMDRDFGSYALNDWLLLGAMVAAPLFYLLVAIVPNRLKKAAVSAETAAAPTAVTETKEEKSADASLSEPVKAAPVSEPQTEAQEATPDSEPICEPKSEPVYEQKSEPVFTAAPTPAPKEKKAEPVIKGTLTAPVAIKNSHLLDYGYNENEIL